MYGDPPNAAIFMAQYCCVRRRAIGNGCRRGLLGCEGIGIEDRKSRIHQFFAIFLALGITVAILLQISNDQNQKDADTRTQKRDDVITNMNGQIGILGLQVTTLTSGVAVLSAKVGQPAPPVQVTIKQPPAVVSNLPAPQSLDGKSDAQLLDYEHAFAEKLHALENKRDEQMRQLEFSMPRASTNPDERNKLWQQQSNMMIQISQSYDTEFRSQFWADALALRDEFKRRFEKGGKEMPIGVTSFGGPMRAPIALDGMLAGAYTLNELGAYFDLLAKEMPRSH